MSLNLKALVYVTIIKCKKNHKTKPECAAVLIILQQ